MSQTRGALAGQTPRTPQGKLALELATKHPEKDARQLAIMVAEQFPKFNEAAMRAMLHHYGIEVAKRVYTRTEKTKYESKPPANSKPAPKPVAQHVAVHSYSGRSRQLAGYYEL
jgi:hypothetical protein